MHGSQSQTSPPFTKRNMNMTYQCHCICKKGTWIWPINVIVSHHQFYQTLGQNDTPGEAYSAGLITKIPSPFLHSFLHLNLRCKQELVASACGVDTGLFAFHVSKLLMIQRLRKSKCFLPKHHSFDREYHNQDNCSHKLMLAFRRTVLSVGWTSYS